MSVLNDAAIASFIAGSFTLASIGLTWYLKNRRSMRKVSAEEFIENFMKRQEQEIERKNMTIREMETTLKKQEVMIRHLEDSSYKKDTVIRQLKDLTKELRAEIKSAKKQATKWKTQLEQMKKDYKEITK